MSNLAWHFTDDTLRGGQPIPPAGTTLRYYGDLKLCESGLHASRQPWDALRYAPGNLLHRVRCEGETIKGGDKLVCRKRTIIQSLDAEFLLRRFAKDQALSVLGQWDAPAVIVDYLQGDDESLRTAARNAAWDAARAAAWDAARAAVRAAAWDAAGNEFNHRVYKAFGLEVTDE